MEHNYAFKVAGAVASAKAAKRSIDASYKDLCEVCSNVRGMDAQSALLFLEKAEKKEVPIRFYSHNAGMGHRKELGGAKGGWPVKSVKAVKEVLVNAIANGKALASPYIAHIQANKQDIIPRMSPKGKKMRMDYETAFVEIVLLERPGAEKREADAKKEKKEAKHETKAAAKEARPEAKGEEKDAKVHDSPAKDEKAAERIAQKAEDAAQRAAVHAQQHAAKKPGE